MDGQNGILEANDNEDDGFSLGFIWSVVEIDDWNRLEMRSLECLGLDCDRRNGPALDQERFGAPRESLCFPCLSQSVRNRGDGIRVADRVVPAIHATGPRGMSRRESSLPRKRFIECSVVVLLCNDEGERSLEGIADQLWMLWGRSFRRCQLPFCDRYARAIACSDQYSMASA